MQKRYSFTFSAALGVFVLVWSFLTMSGLGNVGDGNPVLTPLRIMNRSIAALAVALLSLVFYLWREARSKKS